MNTRDESRPASLPEDDDFDSVDGGWDPYVTSLLLGNASGAASVIEGHPTEPVRSLSRIEERRARRE